MRGSGKVRAGEWVTRWFGMTSPSCRFLGQVPSPLFNSNSMSNLSFPGKGTDRAVPKDSGFGQAA